MDLGSLWEGFWDSFGKVWGAICKDLGLNVGKHWGELWRIGDSWANVGQEIHALSVPPLGQV